MGTPLTPATLEALHGRLGRDFADRYELSGVLGEGGMARVYRARDRTLDRPVAVKVQAHDAEAPEFNLERFRYEAMAGARIRDPHVVQVYEFGVGNGCWWMAVELVAGRSLADELEERGPLAPAEALAIGVDVARGLAAIHAQGLVHRDVKAENILHSDAEGRYKVTDLGLAKGEGRTFQTGVGMFLGTPRYIAPEQVQGQAGPPADWYALGTLLFYMLTLEFPYTPEADMDLVLAKLKLPGPERRASDLLPALPPAVDELISTLLAKDPASRPAGEALLERLEALLARARAGSLATPRSRVRTSSPEAAKQRSPTRASSRGELDRAAHSGGAPASPAVSRRRVPAFAVAAFAFGVLAAVFAMRMGRPAPPPASPVAPVARTGDPLALSAGLVEGSPEAREAREAREVRVTQILAFARSGGLELAGDPAEDNDPGRFQDATRPLPPDVLVDLDLLIAKLGLAFEGEGAGWDALEAYFRDEQVPLDRRLELYRALARWSAGAVEIGFDASKGKQRPPRPAHRLAKALGALVPVAREYPPNGVTFGAASGVLGLTNVFNLNEFVEPQNHDTFRSPQAVMVGKELLDMTLAIRALAKDPAVNAKLRIEMWTAKRLLGRSMAEVVPERPAGNDAGGLALRMTVGDLSPSTALRLSVPVSRGAPLDIWLTQPDLARTSFPCRIAGCNPWSHHVVFTIGLPRGLGLPAGPAAVGLRLGPVRPNGPRATTILTEYVTVDGTRSDVNEAMRASCIVRRTEWIRP